MPAVASIQRGTLSFNDANTTHNVTITAVDTSRAVVMFTWRSNDTAQRASRTHHKGYLTSGTNLRFTSKDAPFSRALVIEWTVVEFESGALESLQSGASLTPSSNPENITLSALTDAAAAVPITSQWINGSSSADGDNFAAAVTSATNLALTFHTTPSGMEVAWQVVEFKATDVDIQSGTIALTTDGGSGTDTNTATITSVNTSKAVVANLGHYGQSSSPPYNRDLCSVALTDATTVTATRSLTSGLDRAQTVGFAVIEFLDDTSVEHGLVTIANGNATPASQPSFTAMANGAVWNAHGFLNGHGDADGSDDNPAARQASFAWDGTDDGLTIQRSSGSGEVTVAWTVVDWAAAAGGATIPVFSHHYRQMIAG